MSFALKISAKMVRKALATQGDNSREPVRSYLCAAWLRVVSFMKWRSKSLIRFQVLSYSLIFASLYSVRGQSSPLKRITSCLCPSYAIPWRMPRGEGLVTGFRLNQFVPLQTQVSSK